jgi:hypothetical protein
MAICDYIDTTFYYIIKVDFNPFKEDCINENETIEDYAKSTVFNGSRWFFDNYKDLKAFCTDVENGKLNEMRNRIMAEMRRG